MKTENINFAKVQKFVLYFAFAFMTYLLASMCHKVYGSSNSESDPFKTRPAHPRCVVFSEHLYGICKKFGGQSTVAITSNNWISDNLKIVLEPSIDNKLWNVKSDIGLPSQSNLHHFMEASQRYNPASKPNMVMPEPMPVNIVILNF